MSTARVAILDELKTLLKGPASKGTYETALHQRILDVVAEHVECVVDGDDCDRRGVIDGALRAALDELSCLAEWYKGIDPLYESIIADEKRRVDAAIARFGK